MKRLMTIILFILILIPINCFAVTLNELQSYPNSYKKIFDSQDYSFYVDVNSIKSIRYAPPYYSIQTKLFVVNYNSIGIIENLAIFNYNYDKSPSTIGGKILDENPKISEKEYRDELFKRTLNDCGITYSSLGYKAYDYEGNPRSITNNQFKKNNETFSIASPMAQAADYIFKKIYNMSFLFD